MKKTLTTTLILFSIASVYGQTVYMQDLGTKSSPALWSATDATWGGTTLTTNNTLAFDGTEAWLKVDTATAKVGKITLQENQTLNLSFADNAVLTYRNYTAGVTGYSKDSSVINIDLGQNGQNLMSGVKNVTINITGGESKENCAAFSKDTTAENANFVLDGYFKGGRFNSFSKSSLTLKEGAYYEVNGGHLNLSATNPYVCLEKGSELFVTNGKGANFAGSVSLVNGVTSTPNNAGTLVSAGKIKVTGHIESGQISYSVSFFNATFTEGASIEQIDDNSKFTAYVHGKGRFDIGKNIDKGAFVFNAGLTFADKSTLVLSSTDVLSIAGKSQKDSVITVLSKKDLKSDGTYTPVASHLIVDVNAHNNIGAFEFSTGSALTLQLDASSMLYVGDFRLMDGASGKINVYVDGLSDFIFFVGEDAYNKIIGEIVELYDNANNPLQYSFSEKTTATIGNETMSGYWVQNPAVPEPAEYALVIGGLALALVFIRRRK